MPAFRAPRFDEPIDLDGHFRLLSSKQSCKGMFFRDVLSRALLRAPEGNEPLAEFRARRYTPFVDYPYEEFLRLAMAAARTLSPGVPDGEALRRLGRTAYDTLLGSHAGRVVMGVLGLDAEELLKHGPKGYRIVLNFGRIDVEHLGPGHTRYHYRQMPSLLETYQVGVIEGALAHCNVTPRVLIELQDLANATLDISWG